MRKTTIGLLLLLCSLAAFGQNEPQWKVVRHGILTDQTAPILSTPIFTPTKTGIYRMSAYISLNGFTISDWEMAIFWTDLGGSVQTYQASPEGGTQRIETFMFIPKEGTPVEYYVSGNDPTRPYNIAFTIEQLQ
jgi:hypothetical protein